MIEYVISDFNIDQIARSGQCFRFRREGEGRYSLIAGGKWLDIEQNGETVCFSCTENEFEGFWRDYFDLNADYGRYKSKVAKRDAICVRRSKRGAACASCGRSCGKRSSASSFRSRTTFPASRSAWTDYVRCSERQGSAQTARSIMPFRRRSASRSARRGTCHRSGSATARNTSARRRGRSHRARSIWKRSLA